MTGFFKHLIDRHQTQSPAIRPRPRSRFEPQRFQQTTADISEVEYASSQPVNPDKNSGVSHSQPDTTEIKEDQVHHPSGNNYTSAPHADLDADEAYTPITSTSPESGLISERVEPDVSDKLSKSKYSVEIQSKDRKITGEPSKITNLKTGYNEPRNPLDLLEPGEVVATSTPIPKTFVVADEPQAFEEGVLKQPMSRQSVISPEVKPTTVHTDPIITKIKKNMTPSALDEGRKNNHPDFFQAPHTEAEIQSTQTVQANRKDERLVEKKIQEKKQITITHETPSWLASLQSQFSERWHQPSVDTEPVVNVSIGKVEVRAVKEEKTNQKRSQKKRPAVMTLDDYLRRREGGRR